MTRLSSAPDEGGSQEASAGDAGAPATDSVRGPMLATLQEHLGGAVVGSEMTGDDLWVRVERSAWRQAAEVCRAQLDMDYFCFLSGIDWMVNRDLSGEKVWDPSGGAVLEGSEGGPEAGAEEDAAEPGALQTGVAGGETRFQVFARLYSTKRKAGVTLKADLDEADLRVPSWVSLYRGADWHERETWEMYGFDFEGHPALRHIYLPGEFEGHPLRKDFPLLAREVKPWPGLVDVEPMPGEEPAAADQAQGEG